MWSLYYIVTFYLKKSDVLLLNFESYLKSFYNDFAINVLFNNNSNKV